MGVVLNLENPNFHHNCHTVETIKENNMYMINDFIYDVEVVEIEQLTDEFTNKVWDVYGPKCIENNYFNEKDNDRLKNSIKFKLSTKYFKTFSHKITLYTD